MRRKIPLDLGLLGMPKCQLLVSWIAEVGIFSTTGGTLHWNATLPNNPGLVGRGFYNQVWVLDAAANARGIATSNGGRARLQCHPIARHLVHLAETVVLFGNGGQHRNGHGLVVD